MIERIVSIHNVGKFEDYDAPGDVTFRRVTLIYGENAQGKTTLSMILRSLSTGEAQWIQERRTIGTQQDPDVLIRLTGTNARFRNGAWDNTCPSIEIFDPVFVNDNVHAGEAIELDHRRNLYRFAIGEEGVGLSRTIEDYTAAISQLTGRIRELRDEIQNHDRSLVGDDVDAFVALSARDDIDGAIEQKTTEIETLQQADAVASRELLSELRVPEVPVQDIESLLSRQLADVSTEAEGRVKQHFEACMDERGETWVRQGMDYISDERCPFCGEDISAVDLIAAYRDYFSQAYSELKEQIARTRQQVEELMSEQRLLALQRHCAENVQHADFWRQHVAAEYPQLDAQQTIQVLQDLRAGLTQHLDLKAGSPLSLATPDNGLIAALDAYRESRQRVAQYNVTVGQINQQLEAKKTALTSADLDAAQTELRGLQATKLRYSDPVDNLCTEYSALQRDKRTAKEEKGAARTSLQQYTASVLGRYQAQINEHLVRFGADFRIVGTGESFRGGNPSMDYHLEIRGQRVPLADRPQPCFRNTLSSGDKATLAFAFFLARIALDPAVQEKVVVFDDPTSRLDCFRQKTVSQAITRIASQAKQVLLLSYDPYLLRDVWDQTLASDRQAVWIARTGSGSSIVEWDICGHTQSPHERNHFMLRQFVDEGQFLDPRSAVHNQDSLRTVAQCIRPLLEHYIKEQCPGVFQDHEWLGDMVRHIEQCQPSDAANCLKPLLGELTDINEYSAPFHHRQNPSAGTHPVEDGGLRAYASRALAVVQR